MLLITPRDGLAQQGVPLTIEAGGSHRLMWLFGNVQSKPKMPLYQGLNLPLSSVLSFSQSLTTRDSNLNNYSGISDYS